MRSNSTVYPSCFTNTSTCGHFDLFVLVVRHDTTRVRAQSNEDIESAWRHEPAEVVGRDGLSATFALLGGRLLLLEGRPEQVVDGLPRRVGVHVQGLVGRQERQRRGGRHDRGRR